MRKVLWHPLMLRNARLRREPVEPSPDCNAHPSASSGSDVWASAVPFKRNQAPAIASIPRTITPTAESVARRIFVIFPNHFRLAHMRRRLIQLTKLRLRPDSLTLATVAQSVDIIQATSHARTTHISNLRLIGLPPTRGQYRYRPNSTIHLRHRARRGASFRPPRRGVRAGLRAGTQKILALSMLAH